MGQAAQALQDRLEAARARTDNAGSGCITITWQDIATSIENADADRNGIADDGTWVCCPLHNQATAVAPMPVVDQDLQDNQGTIPVSVHDQGSLRPYLLAMFFIDANRTFVNTNVNKWKFEGDGQGQGEIHGVFLVDSPSTLGTPPSPEPGGVVKCEPDDFVLCFIQLGD